MSSTLTKLGLLNEVLTSIGERRVASVSANQVTELCIQCIQDALYEVCNSNTWSELREISVATSWSADSATLSSNTTRVRNVFWYVAPEGTAETGYDYNKLLIPYIDAEQYEGLTLVPFEGNGACPRHWTIQARNVLKVNPYPTDTLGRSKVFFEHYRLVDLPSSSSGVFSCSNLLLNCIKWKACEIMSAKHLGDFEQAQYFMTVYENLMKQHRKSDSGQGVKGFSMFRPRRGVR